MEDLSVFGLGKIWTLFIGYGELLGVLGLIVGIWHHQTKQLSILCLFPFAIGALIVHFAHYDYTHF